MLQLIDNLTTPGERLPVLGNWLLELWSGGKYPHDDPIEFLQTREQEVNFTEEIICASAWRLYDEFQSAAGSQGRVRAFLNEQRPCAVVVFDGLSLREIPAILHLALQSGLEVGEVAHSIAALPSETVDFVEQKLGLPQVSPSQLPSRRELRESGIATYYLASHSVRELIDPNAQAILIWSAFPDNTYKDSGARFAQHFAQLDATLRLAWRNTVQCIPPGRRILVTSDHGYVFFGHGFSFPRKKEELGEITRRFGGQRFARLRDGEAPLDHPDVATVQAPNGRRVMMLRGRVQTHTPGEQSNRLYKHGGLSLMEMFIPWIVLKS
jgi:hypothetical protein